ncbi:Proline-rich nuclear receptor coactivator 1 [Oryzias melastigma]|uniref:Proline-rich nuclear receptor coactivator 1 n=1 Tax=Oryzias melastigma TaxID=30732 RepID=A0A3B3CR64_ORYME|nr:proline-rich nuclear receptor coactivator 1 [Oryzias melastigma]KAF6732175.1 Proline-rich nuclear receptor coactivator 1 [Oryzias melastigma]
MLDGAPTLGDEAVIGDVENNKPNAFIIFGNDRMNAGSKTKEALLKRGGWKLRAAVPLHHHHHHKPPRNCSTARLSDNHHNTSAMTGSSPSETPLPVGSHASPSVHHHVKQGPKKELLKPKSGRLERGSIQSGLQAPRTLSKHDQTGHTHKPKQNQTLSASPCAKKNDTRHPKKSPSSQHPQNREQKKPLHTSNNVKTLNPPADAPPDGEKTYAGAKFSEPPSPSVLPKPPSHWFGKNEAQQSNQSQEMTVHLKSLLKVQD